MFHAAAMVAVVKALLVSTVAVAVLGLGFPATSSSSAAGGGKIELTALPSFSTLARRPAGRAGNVEILRWSLRERHGKTIGDGRFLCRWIRSARLCVGELEMPLGKIAVIGSSPTRYLGEWSVVGGTGRYEDAGGTLRFTATGFGRLAVVASV